MDYQTYSPHVDLSDFIKCYWTLKAPEEKNPEIQRIVSDGSMEMIFHLGDYYFQYLPNGERIVQPKAFVFGQITRALEIQPSGEVNIFAIRFQPDGFAPFVSGSINSMENRAVAFEELFTKDHFPPEKEIRNATSTENRISLIEKYLLKCISNPQTIDRMTRSCVEMILQEEGDLKVEDISEQVKMHRRQLERKFSASIGLSPKQLAKIVRIQSTLKKLVNKEIDSLSALAQEGNYYDQAHFIKDFKEFTGESPKNFYASNLKMSQLFAEGK